MHGRGEKKCTRFWWERLKERDHSEDQGIDGENGIGKDLRETGWGCGLDWAVSG
jgi:hypothetical protein